MNHRVAQLLAMALMLPDMHSTRRDNLGNGGNTSDCGCGYAPTVTPMREFTVHNTKIMAQSKKDAIRVYNRQNKNP